jgi:hypothetical protein
MGKRPIPEARFERVICGDPVVANETPSAHRPRAREGPRGG